MANAFASRSALTNPGIAQSRGKLCQVVAGEKKKMKISYLPSTVPWLAR